MGFWLTTTSSQSTNPSANTSTYTIEVFLNWNYNAWYQGFSTTGVVVMGNPDAGIPWRSSGFTGPDTVNNGGAQASGSVKVGGWDQTFTHSDTGYRPMLMGSGGLSNSWIGNLASDAPSQPALDYDRRPSSITSVSSTLNSDKSITVSSNAVSSPASGLTYYISYSSDSGGSWSGWENLGGSRTKVYSLGSLTMGLSYRFRMYASNNDGASSTFTQGSDLFLPAGGRRFDGSSWNATLTARRFDGSNWNTLTTAKRFDGSSWVNLS